jgi:hypothetical protein
MRTILLALGTTAILFSHPIFADTSTAANATNNPTTNNIANAANNVATKQQLEPMAREYIAKNPEAVTQALNAYHRAQR